jgi:DNA polymerase III alpha subunit (gram-positive type)
MSNLAGLLKKYKAVVMLDTETSGLDPETNQIIELAAIRVEATASGGLRIAQRMDTFIRLPEGETLPEKIVELTGITDDLLDREGVRAEAAAGQLYNMVKDGPVVIAAYNAQFDLLFIRELLRGRKFTADFLDVLTVYKDRRAYPHKLANAIIAYELQDKAQNTHRAIDDVLAMFEVMKAMDAEREDLDTYINLFGYNPKYGVTGERISGVTYKAQQFTNFMRPAHLTLPSLSR